MRDKYYIPTIEEFYVGFEYERMNGERWEESELLETDCYGTLARGYENEFEEIATGLRTVRVKYLDHDDILELGFEHTSDAGDHWYTIKGRFDMESRTTYKMQMYYGRSDNKLYISADDPPGIRKIFEGTIKNKSELIKLMTQLNIS